MERTNTTLCSPRPSTLTAAGSNKNPGPDPTQPTLVTTPLDGASLAPNHILIRVDHFGFSANNVTYQALGEHPHFRYFDYHPAPTSSDTRISPRTHGLIPVWGFATIISSTHPKISVGERVYGYFAPAKYLTLPVSSNDANKFAFYVPRPHLPPDRRPYNQILRCASDPQYKPEDEELTMLYRPLFWTSYWFEDYLHTTLPAYASSSIGTKDHSKSDDHVNFLISSASAKTAFCLAYLIRKRVNSNEVNNHTRIVGLTSSKNLDFTKDLGLYTDVHTYDHDLAHILRGTGKWVYVDVSGNDSLNTKIRDVFADEGGRLMKAVSLGLTNLSPGSEEGSRKSWNVNTFSNSSPDSSLPQQFEFEQFFMPEWLAIRRKQLLPTTIFARQKLAWDELMCDCRSWVRLERVCGARNVKGAYERLVKGGLGPEKGLILSMWDEDGETKVEAKL